MVSQVEKITLPVINKYAFELVDIEYIKEGSQWYLRVYIDNDKGITIDDCSNVSLELAKKLDEIDPITEAYILEVSSPGLDRPLKTTRDFHKYKGEIVEISLYKAIDGIKHFEGELVGLIDENIFIRNNKNKEISFEKKDVACIKRKIIF
ncbi:MAG TPA: ribosome maturation factor RimP [Clostridia bacterium]|nr:ribosome maturation factor RimP [Clostridia bacterium]